MRLIIGKTSSIGSHIYSKWASNGIDVIGTSRQENDINNGAIHLDLEKGDFSILDSDDYSAVVISAGMTRIHQCQDDPEKAFKINVTNTHRLIESLSLRTKRLVFLSSSRVFDGTVKEPTTKELANPTTVYGKTKHQVELILKQSFPEFTVLRLSKILDEESGLLNDWHSKIKDGKTISAFVDMYMTPTYLNDVSNAVEHIIDKGKKGIQHLSPLNSLSYFEFAQSWCERHGYDNKCIEAANRPIEFPEYCCLG